MPLCGITETSSDAESVEVVHGEATFVFPGSESAASSEAKKVEDPAPAPAHNVGETVANGGASYEVSSVEEGKETVKYVKADSKKATNATIPDAITIDSKEYKVTEIAANAFKNNKKLKKVTIGKNAFKHVHPKAKAKVPKKVLKAYKKFLPGKGLNGKGQKITK